MKLLDLTLPTPAENLALEEALLDRADDHGEVLRLWESAEHFVVLGAGCFVERDVDLEECAAAGVPVLRRCSGGGTVLQGPGCLNFSVVLDNESRAEARTIDATTRLVLGNAVAALERCGIATAIRGTSDLVVDGVKFGGNAQRRKKRFILFHGTILHQFNIELVSRCLREPEKQPDYRANRSHQQFIANVALDTAMLKRALAEQWGAGDTLADWPREHTESLVARYGDPAWTNRL